MSTSKLMVAFLGGGLAWLVHLLSAWAIAEFGCIAGWGDQRFLAVTAVAWLIVVVSLLTILAALTATWIAYHCRRQLLAQIEREGERPDGAAGTRENDLFVAATGVVLNMLFVFIIIMESVPILYFLRNC